MVAPRAVERYPHVTLLIEEKSNFVPAFPFSFSVAVAIGWMVYTSTEEYYKHSLRKKPGQYTCVAEETKETADEPAAEEE
jgi:hypothetical protein